jgi:hypothetical protein
MASPGLSEAFTVSLRLYATRLADNMSDNNAIVNRLGSKGRINVADGGTSIDQALEYADNSTFMWYSGYEQLDISPSDVLTSAQFDWKQASVAVSMSGLDVIKNSGRSRIINHLSAKVRNAEKTMRNNLAVGMYSDGSGSSGKQIGGLQLLVADAPTSGTVGGIDRASWTFWQNQVFSSVTDGGATASSSNMQGYMNRLWLECSRDADHPDLILADDIYFNNYWSSLQAIQRITDSKLGKAGFQTLKYMDADVVFDGGQGGACPASHMYMLDESVTVH